MTTNSSDLPTDDKYRQHLYEVRGDPSLSLGEKLEEMLALGCEYLEVENGHIKRVDEKGGTHEVLRSSGDPFVYEGDLHQHASTYCRKTIERDSPLAISEATDEGWGDDPAYRNHGLECYLGSKITIGGETFGTVCFVDRSALEAGFTPSERAFVELVAAFVGNELEELRYDHELGNRELMIRVLNRVLRHNLRNGMNAAAGFAEILAENLDGEQQQLARQIQDTAHALTEIGEKARQLETVATDPHPPSSRDIVPIVTDVVATLEEEAPAAEFVVQTPPEQEVLATEHIRDALYELGRNAILHAGETPRIEYRVQSSDDDGDESVTVVVSDDGPGLPSHERRLLEGDPETPLDHGSGLGLWLVYWIVNQTDGDVTVEDDEGTTVCLSLRTETEGTKIPPRSPYVHSALDR